MSADEQSGAEPEPTTATRTVESPPGQPASHRHEDSQAGPRNFSEHIELEEDHPAIRLGYD